MKEYFKIIREALSQNRVKNNGVYYESHHIIPKSFNKKSLTVLLTPEEHYYVHKILAEYWKDHFLYGKKMLWAFHRISYDKNRKISKEEYGEARRILMSLWTRKQTKAHSQKISKARTGKKTIVHPVTNQIKYVNPKELKEWITLGWNNTNLKKGQKGIMSDKGKLSISESIKKYQTGKVGLESKASKGAVIYQDASGNIFEAGSCLQLSYIVNINQSSLAYRLKKHEGKTMRGYSIRYKN
jgi:hypothetical protein